MKKEYVRHNTSLYLISYNSHPECQRVKMEFVKILGIEDPGLWKICPEKYRYLLHRKRQQILKTPDYEEYVMENVEKCQKTC